MTQHQPRRIAHSLLRPPRLVRLNYIVASHRVDTRRTSDVQEDHRSCKSSSSASNLGFIKDLEAPESAWKYCNAGHIIMGRYLTASKIALLVLAVIYTEGVVPLSDSTNVLSFIVKHTLLDLKKATNDLESFSVTLPISHFEAHLAKRQSNIPGRSLWDLLVKKLWAIDCSAALDNFIDELPSLLSKSRDQLLLERDAGEVSDEPAGRILRTSPLGAFIRRCHLEYARLQFQDSISIWQDLISYRHPSLAAFEKKNNVDGRSMLDVNFSHLGINASHPLAHIMFDRLVEPDEQEHVRYSTGDVEKLLEFQVSEMQQLGGRLPEDMRTKLEQMSKPGVTLPKLAYYLRFLDSWRAGDYSSAFDNLHRYFDYTMQSRDRTFYQYALLNLAILQADFGCHAEAIPAMQEAIATARENRDTICLNFCMSWLYHFGRSFPVQTKELRDNGVLGSEIEGLSFLKSRAKDSEMWSLLSTSLLSEAKLGLQHGDSLAIVFENIVKASYINNVKAIQNVTGPALLMKGSVFIRTGQNHMGQICGETFLQCYSQEAPIEDVLKCSCRLAGLLVQRGRYTEAEATMSSVPEHILRVLKFRNYWTYHSTLLKLRRFLHRDDLDAADQLARKLKGQGPPDIESDFALSFLEIELYTRKGELETALRRLEDLADRTHLENNDVMIHARLMTLKAGLWAKSGHAMKGFSLVMRAANIAYNARLLPALWEAMAALASIMHVVQEFTASKDLLEAITPQVLECQDCELAARTYCLLADANMGLAGLEEAKSTKRKEHMAKAMEQIDAAFEQFRFVEDLHGQLEMLAKKGRIQHFRGDLVLANDTASRYLEIKEQYVASRA